MFDQTRDAVRVNTVRAEISMLKNQTFRAKVMLKVFKSVSPVGLNYPFFGYLGKNFMGDFFRALILRTFEAVIVFDYIE